MYKYMYTSSLSCFTCFCQIIIIIATIIIIIIIVIIIIIISILIIIFNGFSYIFTWIFKMKIDCLVHYGAISVHVHVYIIFIIGFTCFCQIIIIVATATIIIIIVIIIIISIVIIIFNGFSYIFTWIFKIKTDSLVHYEAINVHAYTCNLTYNVQENLCL